MIRKLTMALCLAAGTAFAAQSVAFADEQKSSDKASTTATEQKEVADPATDALIKSAETLAAKAEKNGKTTLANAYNQEIEAYKKLKTAKASGDAAAIKAATAEVEKAKKAVKEASEGKKSDKAKSATKK